jgi:TonB family protein
VQHVRTVAAAIAILATAARALAQEDQGGEGAVPHGPGAAVARPAKEEPAPAAPQIVMPVLKKNAEPVYPPEALAAGLQADVYLKITVDREGKVTRAEVPQLVGHGFDEAAKEAALKLEFEPATRDGKPIPVVIPFHFAFTFTVEEKPAPEPMKTGNIGGQILLAANQSPVAGATITVTGPANDEHQTTSDAEGKWNIDGLAPAFYRIRVTLDGFAPEDATEEVIAGQATNVVLRLSPAVEPGAIEVTVTGTRPPREVTRRTIERREMERIPGTSGDALRSIQSLPGVARPPGLAGLLIVRGSAPQDTAIYVDGAVVPIVYHFGGLSSVIPTELLDQIDFYPGNFSARYGQVMGGVVDVALRKPDTDCNSKSRAASFGSTTETTSGGKNNCYHAMAELDLIDARAMVQGPIGKDWSFAAAGRRSWVDAWAKPVLEGLGAGVTQAPVYYDYQLIADTSPSKDSHFSARFFGSDDKVRILITDPFAQDPGLGGNLTFGTSFYRAQALYNAALTKSVDLSAMIAGGNNAIDFALGTLRFNANVNLISTRSELGFKIARGVKLNAGTDFLLGSYDVFVRGPQPPRPGEANPGPLTTQLIYETNSTGTVFRPGWYADAEIQPTRRLLIVPGARLDFARDTGHADFSPRINARYDLIGGHAESELPPEEQHNRTTLKGGVGYYYQPPQFQETNAVFGTPGLLSNRSVHYSVGVEQELSRHVEMSIEGYYKALTDQVSRQPDATTTYLYGNQGVGTILGMELLIKYKPDSRFFGWLAYTLSRSTRRDAPGLPEYLAQYDQTHNLTMLGSYRLGRGWEFGMRYRIISGPLVTPVTGALYAADASAYTELTGAPFSRRLPLFHQLDVRIDKGWRFRDWRLSAYLELLNVYNNAAKETLDYNYNFTQTTYQNGLPFIPNVGIRGDI